MAKKDYLDVLGSSGLRRSHGYVLEERVPRLQGERGLALLREMADNSAVAGAVVYAIETLTRGVVWHPERPNDTPDARFQADYLAECISDMSMSWDDVLSEVLTFTVFGFSPIEIVYKIRRGNTKDPRTRSRFSDGLLGWRMLALRGQETIDRWEFDDDGTGIRGMWQWDPETQTAPVYIPIERLILFRVRRNKNNPEGRRGGLFRNAFNNWWHIRNLEILESIGHERDLVGMPVYEVPETLLTPNAPPEKKAMRRMLETLVTQIKRHEREGVVIPHEVDQEGRPTGYKLRLLGSGGNRQMKIGETITRHETRFLQSVLWEVLMLGTGETGARSLGETKLGLVMASMESLLDNIAVTFNAYGVSRLMALNGFNPENTPKLVHGGLQKPKLMEMADYVSKLAGVGLLSVDDKLERKLREIGDLPQLEGETSEVE